MATETLTRPTTESRDDGGSQATERSRLDERRIGDALVEVWRRSRSNRDTFEGALEVVARYFDAALVELTLASDNESIQTCWEGVDGARQAWRDRLTGLLLATRYRRIPMAKFYATATSNEPLAALAVPLRLGDGAMSGAMAIVVRVDDKYEATWRLRQLQTLASFLSALVVRTATKPAAASHAVDGTLGAVGRAAAYGSLAKFAFALVNGLQTRLDCQQVCIGVVQRRRVELLCVSGLDEIYPRSDGTRMIVAAMTECLDAQRTVCFQNNQGGGDTTHTGHRLHRKWYEAVGGSAVASVPVVVDDQAAVIVAVQQNPGKKWSGEQLAVVQDLVGPLVPGLHMLQVNDRSLVRHFGDETRQIASALVAPGAWGRRLVATVVACMLLWMAFGYQTHWVTVPCTVQAARPMQLSAPFTSRVQSVRVEPGQRVVRGQVLATLDTQELASEKQRLESQLRLARIEMFAHSERNAVSLAAEKQAELAALQATLDRIERSLADAALQSPVDGVVLTTQFSQRLGDVVTLGEPLIEIAAGGQWRVDLQVPESLASLTADSQEVRFVPLARPDLEVQCQIDRVRGTTEIVDGRNVVATEAAVLGQLPGWARAGMEGSARINTGRHPVWWIWLHRGFETVRLSLWKL